MILSCMRCLYILETHLLSAVSFANISSHSEDCLFALCMVSFAVQKFLSLIRYIYFILITLGGGSEKDLAICPRSVLCFPLRISVSGLTYRSLIYFEFIFMHGVRECPNFILLHKAIQFFQHYLLKEAVFAPLYILASFVIN